MRPAPFDKEYSYTDPSTGMRLVSTNNGDDGYTTEGVSTIFDTDGNKKTMLGFVKVEQ